MIKKHIGFTICTKSYLAGALEWRRTLSISGSGVRGLIYVTDVDKEEVSKLWEEVKINSVDNAEGIEIDLRGSAEKDIPDDKGMRERYAIIEYCTAIKPSIFLALEKEFPSAIIHYFDPDISIYSSLSELKKFSEGHSITLIPHMTTPTYDNFRLTQLDILRAGVFNFGYLGWNPEIKSGKLLIQWWQGQLKENCRVALDQGIFTDQSWGVFFCSSPETGIFHDKSYNVAYWNLHERSISLNDVGDYLVNDQKLQFFHFSGYSPKCKDQISLHQNRHSFTNNNGLKILFNEYSDNLIKAGFDYWRGKYGNMGNLETITSNKKELAHIVQKKIKSKIPNPFHKPYKNLLIAGLLQYHYTLKCRIKKNKSKLEKKINSLSNKKNNPVEIISSHNQELRLYIKKVRTVADQMVLKKSKESDKYIYLWLYWVRKFIKQLFIQFIEEEKNNNIVVQDNTSKESTIALIGYLTAETGVGESARGIVRAIESAGGKIDLFDIRGHYARAEDLEYSSKVSLRIGQKKHYETSILCVNADQVDINIKSELGDIHSHSSRKIAYWYWETEKLPLSYVHVSHHFDQIWVATEFVKKSLINAGIQCPVIVIPPALSELPEKYREKAHFSLQNDVIRPLILSVFDATSFLGRKNPIGAIRVVQRLQRLTSIRPILILKTTNLKDQDEIYLKSICPEVDIFFINKYLTKNETLSLIKASNCFLSLHRAEGLGLSLIDAMRIGTPLLSTDYSGPVDFANKENAWMVPWEYTNATTADGPYFGSQWADPIEEKAAKMLHEILTNTELRDKKVKQAKKDITLHFSKSKITTLINAALNK